MKALGLIATLVMALLLAGCGDKPVKGDAEITKQLPKDQPAPPAALQKQSLGFTSAPDSKK